jgi:hypothetical protein
MSARTARRSRFRSSRPPRRFRPQGQQIHDTNLQTQLSLAGIGRDQAAKIGGILGTNVNLNNDAVEGRLMDLGSKRLDPMFARNEDALRTRLTNQASCRARRRGMPK